MEKKEFIKKFVYDYCKYRDIITECPKKQDIATKIAGMKTYFRIFEAEKPEYISMDIVPEIMKAINDERDFRIDCID